MARAFRRSKLGLAGAVSALGLLLSAREAHAWKPYTHVYLAQQAWEDAKDGTVTLYYTTYNGPNGVGTPTQQKLGDFPVDPDLLRAIRANPHVFFAGVLGPDSYPDIPTGQVRIHPPPGPRCGGPGLPACPNDAASGGSHQGTHDCNIDGATSDAWFQTLWAGAWAGNRTDANLAFAAGFLAHAAGDMYAHSWINNYAGGIFELGTQTMTRHLAIEGYIAERTPPLLPLSFPSGTPSELNGIVNGGSASMFDALGAPLPPSVQQLIADNLFDAPGALPTEDGKAKSLPWIFTRLRRHLRDTIASYEAQVATKQSAFNDALGAHQQDLADMSRYCDLWHNPSTFDADKCAVATYSASLDGAARAAAWSDLQTWQTAQGPILDYFRTWVTTIDQGLREWALTSQKVGLAMMMNDDLSMDTASAMLAIDGFRPTLLAMATGLNPTVRDWLALVNGVDVAFRGQIMAIKDATLDWFLLQAFGKDAASIKSQFEKPHVYLDQLFTGANPPMSVALANRALGLSAARTDASDIVSWGVKDSRVERFKVESFAPAYNTVTMIKLMLLGRDGMNQLLAKLGMTQPGYQLGWLDGAHKVPMNAMLGFATGIDGSNQWQFVAPIPATSTAAGQPGTPGMVLARACGAYKQVFLRQPTPTVARPGEPLETCATMPAAPFLLSTGNYYTANGNQSASLRASERAMWRAVGHPEALSASADGLSATYSVSNLALTQDITDTVIATPADGSGRSPVMATIQASATRFDIVPAGSNASGAAGPLGVQAGKGLVLAVSPSTSAPVTWTVDGAGTIGDPARQASLQHDIDVYDGQLRSFDQQIARASPVPGPSKQVCLPGKPCIAMPSLSPRATLLTARQQYVQQSYATVAQKRRDLAALATTYFAPATPPTTGAAPIVHVTTPDGRMGVRAVRIMPAPPVLAAKTPPPVKTGQALALEVSPPVPMKWSVVSGGGAVGLTDTEKKQVDTNGAALKQTIEGTRIAIGRVSADKQGAELTARGATVKTAATAAALAAAKQFEVGSRTFHAPAKAGPVTLRGEADDGTGRTVTVTVNVVQ